eukprot:TRINITY_DN3385_c0_g1_i1.p1 TRINITY_DN3385_c0_g1~~TRINITY_DN3385_c0_g1_i1.p1  ORF type:complete len:581 (+),score=93.85 TRINITY_DN3385_c0_g1_i1:56-1744(+)
MAVSRGGMRRARPLCAAASSFSALTALLRGNSFAAAACADDLGFRDEFGAPCESWVAYNCSLAEQWGYTEQGKADLLEACGSSCGRCATAAPSSAPSVPPTSAPTLVPVLLDNCKDAEAYIDERGATCGTWALYDCWKADLWGYSPEGKVALLSNCLESCGRCRSASPTAVPTAAPTPPPTAPLAPGECGDDFGFRDEMGYGCSVWAAYDCERAEEWSYTPGGKEALIGACRSACGLCPTPAPSLTPSAPPSAAAVLALAAVPADCKDATGFVDEMGAKCSDWAFYDCFSADAWSYTFAGKVALLEHCLHSCGRCASVAPSPSPTAQPVASPTAPLAPGVCGDQPGFVDEKGMHCEDWRLYSCASATAWSYSEEGKAAILANCKEACGFCDPTVAPSVLPTAAPSAPPTLVPTASPSVSPTLVPTASPSVPATSAPSVSPSSVPTAAPSAPPTLAPSVSPSAAPTSEPSAAPTASPTLASAAPSAAPTWSPSAVPTLEPTVEVCEDTPGFVDEMGYPCSSWVAYDCTRATSWQYTEEAEKKLLENCRKSCRLCSVTTTIIYP